MADVEKAMDLRERGSWRRRLEAVRRGKLKGYVAEKRRGKIEEGEKEEKKKERKKRAKSECRARRGIHSASRSPKRKM